MLDWKAVFRKRDEFENASTIVITDTFVGDEMGVVGDSDLETRTVKRRVEGQLAVDVRKRVKAPADAEVFITEVEEDYNLSDVTGETAYRMTVECNGVEKKFDFFSAHENFTRLLAWVDADPETPIGGEES